MELVPRKSKYYIPNFEILGPGKLAIDCGANIGEVTSTLARSGCDVIAFEPNPLCVKFLRSRFRFRKNVRIIPKAVSDSNKKKNLYLHKDLSGLCGSEASSLEISKNNLDTKQSVIVDTQILSDFIFSINRKVTLLKIDVEGHEDVVLRELILSGVFSQIELAIVEVHDGKYDFMKPRIDALKNLVAEKGLVEKIDLTWH
jgi:FkbM family methyltransferase